MIRDGEHPFDVLARIRRLRDAGDLDSAERLLADLRARVERVLCEEAARLIKQCERLSTRPAVEEAEEAQHHD